MRFYNLILLLVVFAACNAPTVKENPSDDMVFELQSVPISIYDTLALAPGIKAEVLDSLSWPSCMIAYKGGLIIGQNPHRLTGDFKETASPCSPNFRFYGLSENEQFKTTIPGYPTAMCNAPWGGILIATSGQKRFEKGYIYHFKDGVITRLDALGASCFNGVTAHQTKNGKAIIYYSDFTTTNSNLYKFVADTGTNCDQGTVYTALLPSNAWMKLHRDAQPQLSKKHKTQKEVLTHLNEATSKAGYNSNYAIAGASYDQSDGTIKYVNMPLQHKQYLYGSIDYIFEDAGNYEGTTFHYKPFLLAGEKDHYSHPAQFAKDHKNGFWICTGMSIDDVGTTTYESNGGNALLLMPQKGPQSNLMLRVAVAPKKGKFSGLMLDKTQQSIYTTLQDQQGNAVLLKLTGPSVKKLLE